MDLWWLDIDGGPPLFDRGEKGSRRILEAASTRQPKAIKSARVSAALGRVLEAWAAVLVAQETVGRGAQRKVGVRHDDQAST